MPNCSSSGAAVVYTVFLAKPAATAACVVFDDDLQSLDLVQGLRRTEGGSTGNSMSTAYDLQRVSRELEVQGRTLTVYEHTELVNEAGAVVWDAALVLLNFFCTGNSVLLLVFVKFSFSSQSPVWLCVHV